MQPKLRSCGATLNGVSVDQLYMRCSSAAALSRPRLLVILACVWLDNALTLSTHIAKTVAGSFAVLRQLRTVRRSLSRDSLVRLVVSLVLTRLDYCNAVLVGDSARQTAVRHKAAARLVRRARRCDHIIPLLRRLHWLRVPERTEFKICVLMHRCLHGLGPAISLMTFSMSLTSRRVADHRCAAGDSSRDPRRQVISSRGCESLEFAAWRSDIGSEIVSFPAVP